MTDLEGVLVFAGVPLAVIAVVFALVFLTTKKPSREPITKPLLDGTSPHRTDGQH
ncbi:hypothetical protein [Actinoplanes sp. N902-109]|uniref:hypothetical protein n=1 Tax=Actinoplanes sp. (strain N902-109) TaxID=649831 RepID=UPI00039CF792|nr:hypothetical protein [Actinoplanes sp. N902-109]